MCISIKVAVAVARTFANGNVSQEDEDAAVGSDGERETPAQPEKLQEEAVSLLSRYLLKGLSGLLGARLCGGTSHRFGVSSICFHSKNHGRRAYHQRSFGPSLAAIATVGFWRALCHSPCHCVARV